MISAIALMCSIADPNVCMGVSSQKMFPTVEICQTDLLNAVAWAEANLLTVVDFRCIVWGEAT